ncbi:hypothetical protein PUR28_39670 [Streptomyces sp. BE308]|uniref:hypothetical protein n=1 Tax=Streptomyces sp. BE308 TaxID=3002529 RepID=UPI002E77E069|nr:hypothetical protein [Streptomyces sp. BE308]MEE1796837.1 hypothetical protein [Streptomyces sp. BE308]
MCSHTTPGRRFDPGLTEGYCPSCGAGVGSPAGAPTASHQVGGTGTEMCPGSGQPAQ